MADAPNLHPPISFFWALPFVAMLFAIATAPFIHKRWWEKYYPLVVVILGAIASWYYLFGGGPIWRWVEGMEDYLSFSVLLALLVIFFVIDTIDHRKEERHHEHDPGPEVQILGIHNFLFILVIVVAVFQRGIFEVLGQIRGAGMSAAGLAQLLTSREVLMIVAAIASYRLTKRPLYEHNEFTLAPIREVAILFAGIFATMIPAIQFMQVNATQIPLKTPGDFYFASGALSSVLDNAPTYKTFLDTRLGAVSPGDVESVRYQLSRMREARSLEIPAAINPGPV